MKESGQPAIADCPDFIMRLNCDYFTTTFLPFMMNTPFWALPTFWPCRLKISLAPRTFSLPTFVMPVATFYLESRERSHHDTH